jgi:L-asparaginase II
VSILVCVTRNGIVERLERGHCTLSDAQGALLWSVGDRNHQTYLRSSAKPVQATALVVSGAVERFGLQPSQLAVACGSHHGEPGHVRAVLELLGLAGVSPAALQCGTHDLTEPEGSRLARAGLAPTPLQNNCSGKHAAMLAAAQALGAPLESYLALEHPVQQIIMQHIATCADMPAREIHIGIDGCSAPNFALPVSRMARIFALLARPEVAGGELGSALARVGAAMRRHPWLVSGTGGFDTALMSEAGTPIISKGGAEGLQCVGLPALGLGLAVKFESGRPDRIPSVVIAILRALGVLGQALSPALARFDAPPLRNHRGIRVGETQVLLDTGPLAHVAEHHVQTSGR